MSNCETVRSLIEQARDERLPPLVQTALESHLAACPDCARLSVLEDQLGEGLSALRAEDAQIELPAGFRQDVKERLLAEGRNRPAAASRWASGFSAGLAAAACLVLAVVAFWTLRTDAQPPASIRAEGSQPAGSESLPLPPLDSRTAPLLYSTPEVEVIFDDAPRRQLGSQSMQPASLNQQDEPLEQDPPVRSGPREYHF